MVTQKIHDELVEFLSLNTGSPIVQRARPAADQTKSFPRWLGVVLNSKRLHNWLEMLKCLGHPEDVVDALEDTDAVYDFIIANVDPGSASLNMSGA